MQHNSPTFKPQISWEILYSGTADFATEWPQIHQRNSTSYAGSVIVSSVHHYWKEKLHRNWDSSNPLPVAHVIQKFQFQTVYSWNLEKDDTSELINAEKELFKLGHQVTYNILQHSQVLDNLAFLWIVKCCMYSWYILVSIWTLLGSCTCCPQLLWQGIALSWLCYHFHLLERRE